MEALSLMNRSSCPLPNKNNFERFELYAVVATTNDKKYGKNLQAFLEKLVQQDDRLQADAFIEAKIIIRSG